MFIACHNLILEITCHSTYFMYWKLILSCPSALQLAQKHHPHKACSHHEVHFSPAVQLVS